MTRPTNSQMSLTFTLFKALKTHNVYQMNGISLACPLHLFRINSMEEPLVADFGRTQTEKRAQEHVGNNRPPYVFHKSHMVGTVMTSDEVAGNSLFCSKQLVNI
jgi:hypothetical protein